MSMRLNELHGESIPEIAAVSDGNQFTISERFADEGVPYYRGQDVVNHFFVEESSPILIDEQTYSEKHMVRSHLKQGDVLLSIVGTIGELSLVSSTRRATCSCKLAILRPKTIECEYLAVFLASEPGKMLMERWTRGAVQKGLILEDLPEIRVPRWKQGLEQTITQVVRAALVAQQRSGELLKVAESVLLERLGLAEWKPPEPLTYERSLRDVRSAARFDAEYYDAKYDGLEAVLNNAGAKGWYTLDELQFELTNGHTPLRHDLSQGGVTFLCAEHVGDFDIILNSEKQITPDQHNSELARTALREGDVLLTIKGKIGNAALVENLFGPVNINQDVALIRLKRTVPVWWVLTFLNSTFGKSQIEQLSTGAINPFLGLANVRRIRIPFFDESLMNDIANEVRLTVTMARQSRQRAAELLERAKRAVEIAIEQGEGAALAYLESC